ncbi:hypothetical protein [Paludisphaera sp.]|uniref:hypothetical protein n=1 Tax=Paludisphaera sp. TaxID=2017432 RepID=UPI00301DD2CA
MRFPFAIKVGVLVVLAGLSVLGTFALLATRAEAAGSSPEVSKFTLGEVEAAASGNEATISAKAAISDSRPNIRYAWGLRIRERTTREVVLEQLYADRAFDRGGAEFAKPIFEDVVTLPAGDYKAVVSLYDIHATRDPSALTDATFAENHLAGRNVREFTVVGE